MVGVWQEKPPAAEGCRFKDFRFGAFINRCTLKCIKWTSALKCLVSPCKL